MLTTFSEEKKKELDIRPVDLFPLGIIQAWQLWNNCFLLF